MKLSDWFASGSNSQIVAIRSNTLATSETLGDLCPSTEKIFAFAMFGKSGWYSMAPVGSPMKVVSWSGGQKPPSANCMKKPVARATTYCDRNWGDGRGHPNLAV